MKGTFKAGFKYISNIFVVKEREIEIEIGGPTDVKHVAHIGWNDQTSSAPTWMNEFKAGPEFTTPTKAIPGISQWSSPAIMTPKTGPEFCTGMPQSGEIRKKQKRKKLKQNPSSGSRSTHGAKSKAKLAEDDPKPINVEVVTY